MDINLAHVTYVLSYEVSGGEWHVVFIPRKTLPSPSKWLHYCISHLNSWPLKNIANKAVHFSFPHTRFFSYHFFFSNHFVFSNLEVFGYMVKGRNILENRKCTIFFLVSLFTLASKGSYRKNFRCLSWDSYFPQLIISHHVSCTGLSE